MKQSVLVHRHAERLRNLAAPVVGGADAERIRRLDATQEIAAHQVSAVVLATDTRQDAVREDDGLELGEQLFANLTRGRRRPQPRRKRQRGDENDENDLSGESDRSAQAFLPNRPQYTVSAAVTDTSVRGGGSLVA